MTTLTANYSWTKPDVGASDDAWGGLLNTDLDQIDSTVKSVSNVANAAYPAANPSGYQTAAQVTAALPVASSTTPVMDGTAAVGTGTTWARADHKHPSDTSRLPVVGVTDGSDAPAGQIGEVISSVVTSGVSLSTGATGNIASIALTAGDWDVYGEVWALLGTGGATNVQAAINTVNNALPATTAIGTSRATMPATLLASATVNLTMICRVSISAGATYYLNANVTFPSGSVTGTGKIWARRAR